MDYLLGLAKVALGFDRSVVKSNIVGRSLRVPSPSFQRIVQAKNNNSFAMLCRKPLRPTRKTCRCHFQVRPRYKRQLATDRASRRFSTTKLLGQGVFIGLHLFFFLLNVRIEPRHVRGLRKVICTLTEAFVRSRLCVEGVIQWLELPQVRTHILQLCEPGGELSHCGRHHNTPNHQPSKTTLNAGESDDARTSQRMQSRQRSASGLPLRRERHPDTCHSLQETAGENYTR